MPSSVEAVFDWKAYLIEKFGYTNEALADEDDDERFEDEDL